MWSSFPAVRRLAADRGRALLDFADCASICCGDMICEAESSGHTFCKYPSPGWGLYGEGY